MTQAAVPSPNAIAVRATRMRWRVLAWLCSFSALTYIGRICIIQVQENIQQDLHLTPALFAYAFSAFSLAYAFFEVPTGWIGYRLVPRKVLTRIPLSWVASPPLPSAPCILPLLLPPH